MRRICKDCGDVFAFEYARGRPGNAAMRASRQGCVLCLWLTRIHVPYIRRPPNVLASAGQHHLPSSRQKMRSIRLWGNEGGFSVSHLSTRVYSRRPASPIKPEGGRWRNA